MEAHAPAACRLSGPLGPNGIYFREKRIHGADRDSFTILTGNSYLSKDKGTVFYGASALPGVDVSKFRLLGPHYATDGRSVYGGGRLIEGADPNTVELVAKDGTMADEEAAEEAAEHTR